jgi:hypothetical protein
LNSDERVSNEKEEKENGKKKKTFFFFFCFDINFQIEKMFDIISDFKTIDV